MKQLFHQYPKLHRWLLLNGVLLAAFYLLRHCRRLMNWLGEQIMTPFRQMIGRLCYHTSVSVMEILVVLLIIMAAGYLLWAAVSILRAKGQRKKRIYGFLLGAVDFGLTIWTLFCLLWGVHYWTDSFQEQSGIYAQPVEYQKLLQVTEQFARELSNSSAEVKRDERGLFAEPLDEILAYSPHVYDELEKQLPILNFQDTGVKAVHFSRLMSALDFTGVYCPYTGEANVNVDAPGCLLPSTIAHEMAHQRSISSEQECNFLAILASTTSGNPAYEYSGWLKGFIHLGNALYRVNPDSYRTIRKALPESVNADLAYNNAYWTQFEDTVVQNVSNRVYDSALKSWGDERGIKSYGTVVDMLVAYYGV